MPEGKVYLTAESESDSTLTNINIRMTINSKYANAFTVQNLVLEIPGCANTLIKNNINIPYKGIGSYVLDVTAEGDWKRVPLKKISSSFL